MQQRLHLHPLTTYQWPSEFKPSILPNMAQSREELKVRPHLEEL
jgi:hypothetical protein